MNNIIYKNKSFSVGNKVFLRGSVVGTIYDIEENTEEKEVNLHLQNRWGKPLVLTLWRKKVFINSAYRGKLDHLIGDLANELYQKPTETWKHPIYFIYASLDIYYL